MRCITTVTSVRSRAQKVWELFALVCHQAKNSIRVKTIISFLQKFEQYFYSLFYVSRTWGLAPTVELDSTEGITHYFYYLLDN